MIADLLKKATKVLRHAKHDALPKVPSERFDLQLLHPHAAHEAYRLARLRRAAIDASGAHSSVRADLRDAEARLARAVDPKERTPMEEIERRGGKVRDLAARLDASAQVYLDAAALFTRTEDELAKAYGLPPLVTPDDLLRARAVENVTRRREQEERVAELSSQ